MTIKSHLHQCFSLWLQPDPQSVGQCLTITIFCSWDDLLIMRLLSRSLHCISTINSKSCNIEIYKSCFVLYNRKRNSEMCQNEKFPTKKSVKMCLISANNRFDSLNMY